VAVAGAGQVSSVVSVDASAPDAVSEDAMAAVEGAEEEDAGL
jgi:hypothetical protein